MATTAWLHFRLVRYILLFISLFISMYYFPGSNVWGLDRHARVVASSRVIALRRRARIRPGKVIMINLGL